MWTGAYLCGRVNKNCFVFVFNSYVSQSPVRRTAQSALQSALHVMLLSYYIGIYVYFMSVNATFAVAARTRKVLRRPGTCPTTGNILILHKTLVGDLLDSTQNRTQWRKVVVELEASVCATISVKRIDDNGL